MKSDSKYFLLFLIVFICAFAFTDSLQAQCAMCKQAAETSLRSNPKSLARSLNSGILYLMAVPYLMIMFIFRKQLIQLFKGLKARFFKPSA